MATFAELQAKIDTDPVGALADLAEKAAHRLEGEDVDWLLQKLLRRAAARAREQRASGPYTLSVNGTDLNIPIDDKRLCVLTALGLVLTGSPDSVVVRDAAGHEVVASRRADA